MRIVASILVFIFFLFDLSAQEELITHFRKVKSDSLKSLLKTTQAKDSLAAIYYMYGRWLVDHDGEKSIMVFDTSISIAQEINNKFFENRARQYRITALINNARYTEAEKQLQLTKSFYKTYNNGQFWAEWHIRNGFLETEKGNFTDAIDFLLNALEISLKKKDFNALHDIYNRIGIIYGSTGEHEKALEYYNKIIESCKKNNIKHFRTAAYNNGAYQYKILKDTAKAIEYFAKVLELRKNKSSKRSLAFAFGNMTEVELMKGNLDQAILYADSSMHLFKEINLKPSILSKYQGLIWLHDKAGNKKKKIQLLREALHYVDLWDIPISKKNIYKSYSNYLSEIGQKEKAYEYLNMSVIISDSLRLISSQDNLKKLEKKMAKRKEALVLEKMEIASELHTSELKRQSLQSNFLKIITLLLIGFASLLFYRIRERKKANLQLSAQNNIIEKSLKEREILLKEIHHRVKNNLQIVSSMLNLQTRHIKDKNVLSAVSESRNRVKSMALIHQKLYQHNNLKGVVMPDYIETLVSSLIHSYKVQTNIQIHTEIDPICLDVDTTIPIGLILNELITNSIKYAFNNTDKGNIWINLKEENSILVLEVIDDGKGLNQSKDFKDSQSFGYTLIDSLAGKLKANKEITSEHGLKVVLNISNFKKIIT